MDPIYAFSNHKDNVDECIDSRHRQKISGLVCKLDLEKAYDHVDWNFLDYMLDQLGCGHKGKDTTSVDYLRKILVCFKAISGLKINEAKSEMLGIHVSDEELQQLAFVFSCKSSSFPSSYLGPPLRIGKSAKHLLVRVIERIERKLINWKCQTLSFGGRLTLLKTAFSNMLVYFMSIFKCPKLVLGEIEKNEKRLPLERG
ncbi:uncharacterized protein LOC131244040 [Magnolia sinica]|uniref:uncharacterized protein LOC131244040 n=1 Tax=Magnolia sinica TaxID=86752 RepID=UPI002658D3AA|nr:uncharacterized protein LOC131244040 [Magnolia sinica]